MRTKLTTATALAAGALALSGCGNDNEDNLKFLNDVSRIGAETHASVAGPDGTVSEETCKKAFKGRITEIPGVSLDDREEWLAEVERTFVAACVSGKAVEVSTKVAG